MATKRDDYEEEDDSDSTEDKKRASLGTTAIVTGILFLIVAELFLYLLGTKTEANFGVKEIIFGVALAVIITLFFGWVNYMMQINKHLGLIIGFIGTAGAIYGLTRKFAGTYTTTFAIVSAVIAIVCILIQFIKSKTN